MKNIMVDIETLGRRPGCIILSIGAVLFDLKTGAIGEEFYVNIDPKLMKDAEIFHTDKNTVDWWSKQSDKAKEVLKVNRIHPMEALSNFVSFYKKHKVEKLWCQGATFDPPIIEFALNIYGLSTPWPYYAVRDTRTAYDVCGFDSGKIKREGVYHSAVDDCKHQIRCLMEALNVRSQTKQT